MKKGRLTVKEQATADVYPIYLAHDKDSGFETVPSDRFKVADPAFRVKSVALRPSDHQISFRVHTEKENLVLQLRYETVPPEEDGEVALFFHPGNSRRKRHQMFVLKLKPDGNLAYEEYRYEIEQPDVPDDIRCTRTCSEGFEDVKVTIPLRRLRIGQTEQ
jgi:hypothetical protein